MRGFDTTFCLSVVLTTITFFISPLLPFQCVLGVHIVQAELGIMQSSPKQIRITVCLLQPCYSSLQFLCQRHQKYLPVIASPFWSVWGIVFDILLCGIWCSLSTRLYRLDTQFFPLVRVKTKGLHSSHKAFKCIAAV